MLSLAGFFTLAQPIVPYNLGEWTYISKPVFPVKIDASQISVGSNWTYMYNLNNNNVYHIYFYGDWIDSKTDYDVYVFDPFGKLVSIHTEAAGLPEHFYNPHCSGFRNWWFSCSPGTSTSPG